MPTKPELLDVDPASLIIGANIRRRPRTDDLVASLKANGMLQPILAERTDDGITVVDGQRRTIAAIEAGLKTVPVLVTAPIDAKVRLASQFVSNEHRQALEDADRADAVRELTLFGMPAAQIQKRTGLSKETVAAASKISESATSTAREVEQPFDLATLGAIAALEGEPEHEVLLADLREGTTASYAVRQRFEQMASRKAVEEGRAFFAKKHPDVTLLDTVPEYGSKEYLATHDVETIAGDSCWGIDTVEQAQKELGVALRVAIRSYNAWDAGTQSIHWKAAFYAAATDLEQAGLRSTRSKGNGPKTDEEKDVARAERAAVKAWKATADGRRSFIAGVLAKKALPAGWEQSVLTYVYGAPTTNYWSQAKTTTVRQLLALDELDTGMTGAVASRDAISAEISKNAPHRAPHALLAAVIAEVEEGAAYFGKPFESHGHLDKATPAYLSRLEAWGYDAAAERALIAGAGA